MSACIGCFRLAVAFVVGVSTPGVLPVAAEAPKVDALFPAVGNAGASIEIEVVGKIEPRPVQVWVSVPGIVFSPKEEEGDDGGSKEGKDGKGKKENQPIRFTVRIGDEVAPGAYLVRFFNADGASRPRIFVVEEKLEPGSSVLREIEPNNALDAPMLLGKDDGPLFVHGKLNPRGDVDGFALDLEKGETVSVDVISYSIDAPLDPLLHVRDMGGAQLGFNHDATATGLDPAIGFVAPSDGTYLFQLAAFAHPPQANVRFAGGDTSVYRIRFQKRGGSEISDLPEPRENEPNNSREQAVLLEPPFSISGSFGKPGDQDWFAFSAAEAETIRLKVSSAEIGFLTDPVIAITDGEGKELGRFDDVDSKTLHDVAVDWKAPAAGRYYVVVSDLNGRGGDGARYQFSSEKLKPHFLVWSSEERWTVKPGEKVEMKLTVERVLGHKGKLVARVQGLPDGVAAEPVSVPEKGGEVLLAVEAAESAGLFNGLVTLVVEPEDLGAGQPEKAVHKLKGQYADPGDLAVNETTDLWLTVVARE